MHVLWSLTYVQKLMGNFVRIHVNTFINQRKKEIKNALQSLKQLSPSRYRFCIMPYITGYQRRFHLTLHAIDDVYSMTLLTLSFAGNYQ